MGLPAMCIYRRPAELLRKPEIAVNTMAIGPQVAAKTGCCWSGRCNVSCWSVLSVNRPILTFPRLEEASDPDSLSQETIIENLSGEEAHRLSRVRNIGIAVSQSITTLECPS